MYIICFLFAILYIILYRVYIFHYCILQKIHGFMKPMQTTFASMEASATSKVQAQGPVTPRPRNEKRGTRNEKREIGISGHTATEKGETRNRHSRAIVRLLLIPISTPICQISPSLRASLTLYPAADLSYSTVPD